MKRLAVAIKSDMLYQWRYGFYFIYMFMSVLYIVIIRLLPPEWRETALVVILLSDPALLGFFFIGGILQLERGEGLLDALFLSPLRPGEYILSKGLSLGLVAAASGLAVSLGSGIPGVNYALLLPAMLIGSMCFTFIGVAVSVNLRSTNAFLGVDGLWEILLLLPPLLLIFDISFGLLEAFPGSMTLRLIQSSIGESISVAGYAALLAAWTAAAFFLAHLRLTAAISRLGGGAV